VIRKIVNITLAVLALPMAAGLSRAFASEAGNITLLLDKKVVVFAAGVVAYAVLHLFLIRPSFLYVFGHELVHAIATFFSGGKVYSFHASRSSGRVKTSKTNAFIELSPYFVPFYTLILHFLVPVVRYKLAEYRLFYPYMFVAGYTLGMHLVMNADCLKMRQPDLKRSGYFFSLVVIYVANLLVVLFLLTFVTRDISFGDFWAKGIRFSGDNYAYIWQSVMRFVG